MTLERIMSKKLKTFLRESFPGSDVTNNLNPVLILPLIKKILKRPFRLNVFVITTDTNPEEILSFCDHYHFERDWLKQDAKAFNVKHNGLELFFERDDELLWLAILPFDGFQRIITVKIKTKKTL